MTPFNYTQKDADEDAFDKWERQQPGYRKAQILSVVFALVLGGFFAGLILIAMGARP